MTSGAWPTTLASLFGLSSKAWLVDPHLAFFAVIVADVWQWTPFIVLITLAGLQAVPRELIDAARVDGANWLQIQRYIALPTIRAMLAIGLLIRLIDAFRNVDQIFVMTYGGPGVATSVLGFYTYLKAFKFFDMGYASALGIIMLFIISVLAQTCHAACSGGPKRRSREDFREIFGLVSGDVVLHDSNPLDRGHRHQTNRTDFRESDRLVFSPDLGTFPGDFCRR